MALTFKQITNDQEWDRIVQSLDTYSFLDSAARYRYNQTCFVKAEKVAFYVNENFVGIVSYTISKTFLGNFLHCQHSPILKDWSKFNIYLPEIKKYLTSEAKKNKCFGIRISPFCFKSEEILNICKENKFTSAPVANIEALISHHIDLNLTPEEIMAKSRKTYRNTVNKLQRQKDDYSVQIFTDDSKLKLFLKLLNETQQTKGYKDKSDALFEKEFQAYLKDQMLYFVFGYYKNEPIGCWLLIRYGKYLTHYQAGLDAKHRDKNTNISCLLFYESIKLGRELNLKTFDMFGGMDSPNCPNHPWKNIGFFKRGFHGTDVIYMHPQDFSLDPRYLLYKLKSEQQVKKSGFCLNW